MKTFLRASIPLLVAAAHAGPAVAAGNFNYLTQPGDSLWSVAAQFLRQPTDWPVLQRENSVNDPLRLPVGQILRIPLRLLRLDSMPARVAAVRGDAKASGQAIAVGAKLGAGQEIVTGSDGFVAVDMADGSRLLVQPGSRLKLDNLQGSPGAGLYRTRLELLNGRVDNEVSKQKDTEAGYRLHTPAAVIAVRGTGFRVAAADKMAQAEVTEGEIGVKGVQRMKVKGRPVAVRAGEGLVVAAEQPVSAAVPLLPAPDFSGLAERWERVALRVPFPAVPGAVSYRAQLAGDAAFRQMLAEGVFKNPEAKFAEVQDGKVWLRVRAIAANGLEGKDAVLALTVKARPEPPFGTSPPVGVPIRGEDVKFGWTRAEGAASYRMQVGACGEFNTPVKEVAGLVEPAWQASLPPGRYAWRVSSVKADGDAGPYGDAVPFEMRPAPANPEPPKVGGNDLEFSWAGETGQKFRLQLARDAAFSQGVVERELAEPRLILPRPEAGVWYMRVRATDPDGFVGPWTATQSFEVPARPWWLLLLLLPALL